VSATGRPGRSTRTPMDFYGTPTWVVERLLDVVDVVSCANKLLEPCAGDGAIARTVNAWSLASGLTPPGWTLIEIRPEALPALRAIAPERAFTTDFLAPELELEDGEFDASCTNPPFETAASFIRKVQGKVDHSFWLLRLSFLESAERRAFFDEVGAPDVFVLPDRPCFKRVWAQDKRGKWKMTTSDSSAYGWFDFPRERRTFGRLKVLATTPDDVRAAAKELAPVEGAAGNVLWRAGDACACGAATRFEPGADGGRVSCTKGHVQ